MRRVLAVLSLALFFLFMPAGTIDAKAIDGVKIYSIVLRAKVAGQYNIVIMRATKQGKPVRRDPRRVDIDVVLPADGDLRWNLARAGKRYYIKVISPLDPQNTVRVEQTVEQPIGREGEVIYISSAPEQG